LTVPEPFPDPPAVTVIHPALLTAVHAHPAATVTLLLLVPPAAAIDRLVGEMDGLHGTVNENVLDRGASAAPPGPTADTTVS
jgi:hypothetical protein